MVSSDKLVPWVVLILVSVPLAGVGLAFGNGLWSLESVLSESRFFGGVGWFFGLVASLVLGLIYRKYNHLKKQFRRNSTQLVRLSHDLRTPLSLVSSVGFNLENGVVQDPRKIRQYGSLLQKEGLRLKADCDQLLAASRLSPSGPVKERVLMDLRQPLQAALKSCQGLFRETGCKVEVNLPVRVPALRGDSEELASVFENLLTNAVKYSGDRPRLQIGLCHRRRWWRDGLELSFQDNGRGIEATELPRIFKAGFRGSNGKDRQGSGMGLALVKQILKGHGARIAVSSRPGLGTRMILDFPLRRQWRLLPFTKIYGDHLCTKKFSLSRTIKAWP